MSHEFERLCQDALPDLYPDETFLDLDGNVAEVVLAELLLNELVGALDVARRPVGKVDVRLATLIVDPTDGGSA